jgi:hypothetical protein
MVAMFNDADLTRAALRRIILEEAAGRRLPAEFNGPPAGYMSLDGSTDWLTGLNRKEVNAEARRFYHIDSSAHHMVNLHCAYTFGRGVSKKAKDLDINAWLDKFWKHPRNRGSLTSAKAQWDLGKDMQLDGEVFFVFYTSTMTGQVTVRTIPPEEIIKIVYAPGDPKMPIAYHRKYKDGDKWAVDVLPDYRVADLTKETMQASGNNTEVAVMHVVIEEFERRGISQLTTAIPWLKALRGFMEDRATLTLAWATYALRVGVKGNRQSMQRIAQQFGEYESRLRYDLSTGGLGDKERRQGGNTLIENEAMTTEQFKVDSGAANAYQDKRMFLQQGAIGHSIFEHYMGDGSNANLATATAMELPMLKGFEFEQQFWGDTYVDILTYVIMQGVRYGKLNAKANVEPDYASGVPLWMMEPEGDADLTVEVMFPPIVQKDVAVWTSALAQITQVESSSGKAILTPEARAMLGLQILGFGDKASGIIDELKAVDFAGPPPPPNPFAPPATDEDEEDTVEALVQKLRVKLKEANKAVPGKPLDKTEGQKVAPITRREVRQAFEEFADMPSLKALLDDLGVSEKELDLA